ncbi:MATE family efflux transporter [Yunchengibacter salinarum]|uniref:MATE family efflux transporter n=1 Tax=Yunchengibacter salinarum TaxID=3133399 RepID=UPI0035B673E3
MPDTNQTTAHSPHRRIWAIAGPAIIANSAAPLVGLVDAWVIGHLPGARYLAAVSAGATVFSFIYWAFGFLRMGTTGLTARAHGRRDMDSLNRLLLRALILSMILSGTILLFQTVIMTAGMAALAPPEAVRPLMRDYMAIRIWSAPAQLAFYVFNGLLIGLARARTALLLHLVLNLTNGALNLVFVLGLSMGVSGIALGSLIAEWIAALMGLYLTVQALGGGRLVAALKERATYRLNAFRALFAVNAWLFIRTLLLITALSLVTRQAGQISAAALAASHVLNTFLMLLSLGLDGFAYAAEALAGAAAGARDRRQFDKVVQAGFQWAIAASLVYTIIFGGFGMAIGRALTDVADVRAALATAMPIMAAMPLVAVWCYQFDGIFIALAASRAMALTMAGATLVYLAILFPLTQHFGLSGLWTAVLVLMGLRGGLQALVWRRLVRRAFAPARRPGA